MSKTPLLSVIMPVYNAQRFVAEAIDSILNQTFSDFEFLIINDGSTDRSLSILKRYAAQDDRIRLTSRPNAGLVATLNELLTQVQGELVARMDADDVALPDRFAQQVAFLQRNPQVVCVGGAQHWIDEAGRLLRPNQEAEQDREIQERLLRGQTAINHPSAMLWRSALRQVGGYDPSMYPAEDLDLWLRLGEVGELANLPDVVLKYRQHDRSISEQLQVQQTQQRCHACERAWKRREISGKRAEIAPWRPTDRASRQEFVTDYGWRFFLRGDRRAAIAYGIKAVRTLPLNLNGWKLLICALVKPLPEVEAV